MSIPSDPSNLPPKIHPTPGTPANQPQNPMPTTSNVDPTGAWSAFLSTPGHQASADDVKMFLQGLLKTFNIVIQQQNQAAQRANQKLKKAAEGNDDD
jgi:hypothetical protein